MVLDYKFLGRDKLAKGQTYPIKRGDLGRALEESDVSDIRYVAYTCYVDKDWSKAFVLTASMTGESELGGHWMKMSPKIGVYSVHAEMAQQIKALLEKEDVLNRLAVWLRELELAETVRRDMGQKFEVYYIKEKLVIEST